MPAGLRGQFAPQFLVAAGDDQRLELARHLVELGPGFPRPVPCRSRRRARAAPAGRRAGRNFCGPLRASGFDRNFAAMGMPVATTFAAVAPRATSRALVSSAATQYKSTHESIHRACASKSVTMLTTKGCGLSSCLRFKGPAAAATLREEVGIFTGASPFGPSAAGLRHRRAPFARSKPSVSSGR